MNISVLLSLFLSTTPTGEAPDLCAEVMRGPDGAEIWDSTGRHLSRYCEWTGPDAPVWDDDVCCEVDDSGATCTSNTSRDGSCSVGSRYSCEYGEQVSTGEVVCYQPLPSMCDAGLCVEAPAVTPPTVALIPFILCCGPNGACVWAGYSAGACEGEILYCFWGMSNEDGTVDCFE